MGRGRAAAAVRTAAAAGAAVEAAKRRPRRRAGRRRWRHAARSIPPLDPEPEAYGALLAEKAAAVRAVLAEHLPASAALEVVASPPRHHRHRVKNRFYRLEGGGLAYKMLDPETRMPVPVYRCPYASKRINELMEGLLARLDVDQGLRLGLGQVEFLSTDEGHSLLCLAYARPLAPDFAEEHLAPLAAYLDATGVVARSRRQRVHVGEDRLVQWYEVSGRRYPQLLLDACFSQHNLSVCAGMLEWAARHTAPEGPEPPSRDLLELYCGNGNFTLPLAANFRSVLAAERDKRSLAAARHCAQWAGLGNVACVRLAAEELAEALLPGGREFRRLREARVDLAACDFGTALANPPRAGLSAEAARLLARVDRVVYVSCSPRTLARDLGRLPEHRLRAAALFDQFPFTSHAEVGVLLEREAAT